MDNERCSVTRDGDYFNITLLVEFVPTDNLQEYLFAFDKKRKKFILNLPKKQEKDRYTLYNCQDGSTDLMTDDNWRYFDNVIKHIKVENMTGTEKVRYQIERTLNLEQYREFEKREYAIPLAMLDRPKRERKKGKSDGGKN